jgi:hypothetical protein
MRYSAIKRTDEWGKLVAFGQYYTSNVRLSSFRSLLPSFCFLHKLSFLISDPSPEKHSSDAIIRRDLYCGLTCRIHPTTCEQIHQSWLRRREYITMRIGNVFLHA